MDEGEPIKLDLRQEGKVKRIFESSDPDLFIVEYKDEGASSEDEEGGSTVSRGAVSNAISAHVFTHLTAEGIPTHFVKQLSDREQLVHAVDIIPVDVKVRNAAAGSFAGRHGLKEGEPLHPTVVEWYVRSDGLEPAPMSEDVVAALGYVSESELDELKRLTHRINDVLTLFFAERQMRLVDFRLRFGKTREGKIIVADELSPDTCRLWDMETGGGQDQSRIRRELRDVQDAYQEIFKRVVGQ